MSEQEPLGGLIDSLGLRHQPEDGELIAGAVVLLKVIDRDGEVSMRSVWSSGLSWMERVGMHRAAEQTELPPRGAGGWVEHGDPGREHRDLRDDDRDSW